MDRKKAAVIMGSDSDWPVVEKAVRQLQALEIETEVHVMSAHRTPEAARSFALSARANGFGVIIAAAGKAAHLAGALAAASTLPVIGIPVKSSTLDGLDALPGGHRRHRRGTERRPPRRRDACDIRRRPGRAPRRHAPGHGGGHA